MTKRPPSPWSRAWRADETSADGNAAAAAGDRASGPPAIAHDPVRSVMVECPLLRTRRYVNRNFRPLGLRHAQVLRDAADGLNAEGERLPNGKVVKTPEDALVWILERLAADPAGEDEGAAEESTVDASRAAA